MEHHPLSLADVTHQHEYHLDPDLHHDHRDLFLPEGEIHDDIHHHVKVDADDGSGEAHQAHLGSEHGIDDAAVSAIKASLSQAQAQVLAQAVDAGQRGDQTGDESNPTIDPIPHLAPFSKGERDENTPHPEYITFTTREAFDKWLTGESSWCHFVQRRTTTPEKRAEERMKARLRAHEKMLMRGSFPLFLSSCHFPCHHGIHLADGRDDTGRSC